MCLLLGAIFLFLHHVFKIMYVLKRRVPAELQRLRMSEIDKSSGFLPEKNYWYTYEVIRTAEKLCVSILQILVDSFLSYLKNIRKGKR